MTDPNWMNNPKLRHIDKAKMEALLAMSEQSKGKSQKELLPFLMAAANKSKNGGLRFSPEESDAIIEVLKQGKSPEEIARIEKIRSMMKLMK